MLDDSVDAPSAFSNINILEFEECSNDAPDESIAVAHELLTLNVKRCLEGLGM